MTAVRIYHGVRGEHLADHNAYSLWHHYLGKRAVFGGALMDWLPLAAKNAAKAAAATGWYDRIVVLHDAKGERGVVLSEQDPTMHRGGTRTRWERTLLCQWAPAEDQLLTPSGVFARMAAELEGALTAALADARTKVSFQINLVLMACVLAMVYWLPGSDWWAVGILAIDVSILGFFVAGRTRTWKEFLGCGPARAAYEEFVDRHYRPQS